MQSRFCVSYEMIDIKKKLDGRLAAVTFAKQEAVSSFKK